MTEDFYADEVSKLRADLVTMTAVAKSNKRATEGYAQELVKALTLLAEYVEGEYPHRRAKQLLAENAHMTAAAVTPPATREER
jgi:hypothetical protein